MPSDSEERRSHHQLKIDHAALPERLLIVEDDPQLARVLGRLLSSFGHEVVTADTCARTRQTALPYALGVFDIDLPDGSGIDLARELLGAGGVASVVFFTGSSDIAVLRHAEEFGVVVPKARGVAVLGVVIRAELEGLRWAHPRTRFGA